jgi:polysaccharide export outer membrane protein
MEIKMKDSKFKSTPLLILSGILSRYFALLFICISMFSCGGRDTVKPVALSESAPKMSNENVISNGDTLEPVTSDAKVLKALSKSDYIIGAEDLIEINVYQVDELTRTVRISSSGFIKLPLAGKINVSGLTVPELETEISKRLQRYLQEPMVSVFIKEYRSQSITVLGAVKKPQVYIVTRQKSLIDILSISGGLTNHAGDICYVRRGSETIIINVRDLLIGGNMMLNIPVFSGDIIHIPIGGILFVDGSVKAPGSFSMKGTVTLTQAIAMAQGFKYEAKRDQIRVYRDSGKDAREIIDVDYDAILAKESPDIILKDKDIVIVESSSAKRLWSGFIESVSGAVSLGSVSVTGGL